MRDMWEAIPFEILSGGLNGKNCRPPPTYFDFFADHPPTYFIFFRGPPPHISLLNFPFRPHLRISNGIALK